METRPIVRYMVNGVGVIFAMMFIAGIPGRGWYLVLGIIALFAGITDFGRQCPLILSARHLAHRMRSKGNPQILSTKPIEAVSEGDRKDIPI